MRTYRYRWEVKPGVFKELVIHRLGGQGKLIKFQPAPPKKGDDGGAASPATR